MSMKKFKLGKLLNNVTKEQSAGIVAIIEKVAKEKGVEVVDLDAVRRDTTASTDLLKAAPKFEGEPKIDKDSRVFPIIVSTRQIDRDNEIVMPKGLNFKDWMKTGVIIDCHDYSKLPIGKAVWVGVTDFAVKFHIETAPTERGEELLALAKFMPLTASIGMCGCEYIRAGSPEFDKATKEMLRMWPEFTEKVLAELRGIISKAQISETSIVPVPANPNAVSTALAKSALSDDEKGVIRKTLKLDDEPETDDSEERFATLEAEIKSLKDSIAAGDQKTIDDQAAEDARLKAIDDKKKKRSVEVVKQRYVKIVKTPDISRVVKLAIDMKSGKV